MLLRTLPRALQESGRSANKSAARRGYGAGEDVIGHAESVRRHAGGPHLPSFQTHRRWLRLAAVVDHCRHSWVLRIQPQGNGHSVYADDGQYRKGNVRPRAPNVRDVRKVNAQARGPCVGGRPVPGVHAVHISRANAGYSKYSRRARATDSREQVPSRVVQDLAHASGRRRPLRFLQLEGTSWRSRSTSSARKKCSGHQKRGDEHVADPLCAVAREGSDSRRSSWALAKLVLWGRAIAPAAGHGCVGPVLLWSLIEVEAHLGEQRWHRLIRSRDRSSVCCPWEIG